MKGYKAFGKGMICRGKQYAENTVFEENSAEICKSGMHFCENPFDVLYYYPLVDDNGELIEVAEVEALDEVKTDDKKKYCTKKLKIGAKLSFGGFINAGVEFLYEKTKEEAPKDKEAASSGRYSQLASSGYGSQLASSGRYSQLASSGDGSQLASSGDGSQLASSGYGSQLASSGYGSQLASSGDGSRLDSTGKHAVIMAAGHGSSAKGKIGSWITLAEWGTVNGEYMPLAVVTKKIDGKEIKEDTFYTLKNGEFVEVE